MNIVHICNVTTQANGIFQVLENLSNAQVKLSHDVSVFNLSNIAEDYQIIKKKKAREIIEYINNNHVDLVIFHGIFYWGCISISRYLRRKRIPYFIELHGAFSIQNMQKSKLKKTIARKLFFDKVIKGAKTIIYLNEQEYKNSVIKNINPSCTIIPNGCEIPEKLPDKMIGDRTEVLFLGRIDIIHKGLDILISAIKLLQDKGYSKRFHFSFYGFGRKDVGWFKEKIHNLSQITDFYGPVFGEDKKNAYLASDIFILTSRFEGFPMGVLEALSFGIPCLVTPATNVADIILDHNAGWVTQLTPEDIVEVLLKADEDVRTNYSKLRENARNLALRYDWNMIARDSLIQYQKVIDKHKKH